MLGLIILFSTQSFSLAYSPLDRIVAIVNEDVIMKSELENKIYTINEKIKEQGANSKAKKVYFSLLDELSEGVYIKNNLVAKSVHFCTLSFFVWF